MYNSLRISSPLRNAAWMSRADNSHCKVAASWSSMVSDDLLMVGLSVVSPPPPKSGSRWPPTTSLALARQGVSGHARRFPMALSR